MFCDRGFRQRDRYPRSRTCLVQPAEDRPGDGQNDDAEQGICVLAPRHDCARIPLPHHGPSGVLLSLRPAEKRLSCRLQAERHRFSIEVANLGPGQA
ncbi:hypothetical protein MATL_G00183300 [Megalops atlanticus]|uniref:Uncharacterized protein n=1 Tax=Megalops atlanticus TaxID=7932 RepID=A0A9D3PSM1_MEGAT|nr:hypothetical protein MATL_G00183300 [Megalops atlanticus]